MLLEMELFSLAQVACYSLLAFGMSYVITGSEIGYWLRALSWLSLCWSRPSKYLSAIMRCPSCNAWWSGALVALLVGGAWLQILQVAFTACGITAFVNHAFGSMAADEDFQEIFFGE